MSIETVGVVVLWVALAFFVLLLLSRLRFPGVEDPRELDGEAFEEWVRRWADREGLTGARVVGGARDMGADVLAYRGEALVAIQAKRLAGSLGTEAVQDAVSGREAHDAAEGWVVTTAPRVTDAARELAERTDVRVVQVG